MKIEERAEELLKPIVEEESQKPDEEGICHMYEIVDVEYVKAGSDWYLRAYIDKENKNKKNDDDLIIKKVSFKKICGYTIFDQTITVIEEEKTKKKIVVRIYVNVFYYYYYLSGIV